MAVTTYTYPDAIVHIRTPDLTPEQQREWDEKFRKITEDFMRAVLEHRQKEKKRER